MTEASYVYRVDRVHRVVDGDTLWAYVRLGFRALGFVELRLDGIDCPELRRGTPFERSRGEAARAMTAAYCTEVPGRPLWIATQPDPEKYGRWLATVWRDGEPTLQKTLFDAELAVLSDGSQKWRDTYDGRAA